MISSMTGFSRYEKTTRECRVAVEIRSLNNRFLELSVRLPRKFNAFEDELKNIAGKELSRGKIDITVSIDGLGESIQGVTVNLPLARMYFKAFKSLEKACGMPVSVKPEDLLKIEDLFEHSLSDERLVWVKKSVQKTLTGALQGLIKHKREEGRNLAKDLKQRLSVIGISLRAIRKIFNSRYKEDLNELRNRISRVLKDVEKIDPQRLEIEAAIMADKFDISEECVRIDSHLKMFRNSLNSKAAVGRRLDFILQEINREVNTIGSKSNSVRISQEVVRIKEEVERLKEQVRNVE